MIERRAREGSSCPRLGSRTCGFKYFRLDVFWRFQQWRHREKQGAGRMWLSLSAYRSAKTRPAQRVFGAAAERSSHTFFGKEILHLSFL